MLEEFFFFHRSIRLMVEYNKSVFYKCSECGQEGELVCPNCGENDTFALEAEFAGCDCGQDVEELKCSCGQFVYGNSFYLGGKTPQKPKEKPKEPSKKVEPTESNVNWDKLLFWLLYILNWKRVLAYCLLIFATIQIIDYLTSHPDKKIHNAAEQIVNAAIENRGSFSQATSEVIWRDSQNGLYIVRVVYEYEPTGQKQAKACSMTAFRYEGVEYTWNSFVGIKSCDYSRSATEAEIIQMVEINSFW